MGKRLFALLASSASQAFCGKKKNEETAFGNHFPYRMMAEILREDILKIILLENECEICKIPSCWHFLLLVYWAPIKKIMEKKYYLPFHK